MLIILEGPDGAGKTTLARDINARLSPHATVHVLHAAPPSRHPLDEYVLPLLNYRPSKEHVICDRWHLGEAIYPAIFGRTTKWDKAVEAYVHLFLQSRGACVFLLNPRIDELHTRFIARGDDLVKLDDLDTIRHAYADLAPWHFRYRYAGSPTSRIPTPSHIITLARRSHLDAFVLNKFETYIGPPKPKLLLLGDVRGATMPRLRSKLPAFAPYPGTSGHFLLTHFPIHGRWGIGNACDVDDVLKLWQTLGYPAVVALGRNAARRLNELDIPHGTVPHPQYVRRFHTKRGDAYADAIVEAWRTQKDVTSWFQ